MDPVQRLSPVALKFVRHSFRLASERDQSPSKIHLLLSILQNPDKLLTAIFEHFNISVSDLAQKAANAPVPSSKNTLDEIFEDAHHQATTEIDPKSKGIIFHHQLFLALMRTEDPVRQLLADFGLNETAVSGFLGLLKEESKDPILLECRHFMESAPMCAQFTVNLTEAAQRGHLTVSGIYTEEAQRLIQVLTRQTKHHPVLVGPRQCGRLEVIEELALRVVQGKVPESLKTVMVLALNEDHLRKDLEKNESYNQVDQVLAEIRESEFTIVLFIGDLSSKDFAPLCPLDKVRSFVREDDFYCIGVLAEKTYSELSEKDSFFDDHFEPIPIREPDADQSTKLLRVLKYAAESHYYVIVSDEAIEESITLSKRYIHGRPLPDTALDLLDEAAAKCRNQAQGEDIITVDRQIIREIVAQRTQIPLAKLAEEEKDKVLNIADYLKRRVIGQDQTVEKVAQVILRNRAGLSDPNRPIASFFFLGPSGVGKTHLAKSLAAHLFDSESHMLRLDMSEYFDRQSATRMIGVAHGYIGSESGGQLTEAVLKQPYSVILFDEIEKAHPEVFNIFLQILDEGRLTDGNGKIADFKNTIIIMTSNVPQEELKTRFRPEFLNRLDHVVEFNALSQADIEKIVEIQFQNLQKERLGDKRITLAPSPAVIKLIAKVGFIPEYGARPIKRAMTQLIEDPLAFLLLKNELLEGQRVSIHYKRHGLEFTIITDQGQFSSKAFVGNVSQPERKLKPKVSFITDKRELASVMDGIVDEVEFSGPNSRVPKPPIHKDIWEVVHVIREAFFFAGCDHVIIRSSLPIKNRDFDRYWFDLTKGRLVLRLLDGGKETDYEVDMEDDRIYKNQRDVVSSWDNREGECPRLKKIIEEIIEDVKEGRAEIQYGDEGTKVKAA